MQFSKQIQIKIQESLRKDRLGKGEVRRIKGMGHTYIASAETPPSDQYNELAVVVIDGLDYYILELVKGPKPVLKEGE